MVALSSLWLPVLLSAAIVFVASFLAHMVLPHHKGDFRKVPAEDEARGALRKLNLTPGEYMLPRPDSPAAMKSPEFLEKMNQGPVLLMTVRPSGPPAMGPSLLLYFLYCVAVSVFAAYVTGRALPAGTGYREVFRFAGTTAFIGYVVALWQDSIWHGRPWSTTLKLTSDGLVYALLTAGTFGWLWPR